MKMKKYFVSKKRTYLATKVEKSLGNNDVNLFALAGRM